MALTVAFQLTPVDLAHAENAVEFAGILEDWSDLPPATPSTLRAQAVNILSWNNEPYLILNTGNGLRIYSLTDKTAPYLLDYKAFVCSVCPATPPGDYDWVLFNSSMCEDCRWGVAHFWQAGLAMFDLGTGVEPHFSGARYYNATIDTVGAFTFSHGGSQYLIINRLVSLNPFDTFGGPSLSCDVQFKATLFRVTGTSPGSLTAIQCVEPSLSVMNGLYLTSTSGDAYVYLIDRSTFKVFIFEVSGSGTSLALTYLGSPFYSSSKFGTGMRADTDNQLLVTAINGTPSARLWDISDPGQPALLATLDDALIFDGQPVKVARAAIHYPTLWLGAYASLKTFTFDISELSAPQPLSQSVWDTSNTWNSTVEYPSLANSDAEFYPDGSVFYLARHSALQLFSSPTNLIFNDSFESSNTTRWTLTVQ